MKDDLDRAWGGGRVMRASDTPLTVNAAAALVTVLLVVVHPVGSAGTILLFLVAASLVALLRRHAETIGVVLVVVLTAVPLLASVIAAHVRERTLNRQTECR